MLQHLEHFGSATIQEFEDALPELGRRRLQWLLNVLRCEGRAHVVGAKRGSSWAFGPGEGENGQNSAGERSKDSVSGEND